MRECQWHGCARTGSRSLPRLWQNFGGLAMASKSSRMGGGTERMVFRSMPAVAAKKAKRDWLQLFDLPNPKVRGPYDD